jgi:predicted metal-binding transcription factor (methanogenesis marker protein 9)
MHIIETANSDNFEYNSNKKTARNFVMIKSVYGKKVRAGMGALTYTTSLIGFQKINKEGD